MSARCIIFRRGEIALCKVLMCLGGQRSESAAGNHSLTYRTLQQGQKMVVYMEPGLKI